MNKLKEDLKAYIKSLYNDLDYHIPHTLEWKKQSNNDYLLFSVRSGESYKEKDHDDIIKKILNSQYKDSISEVFTLESTRRYQVWLYSKKTLRKFKLKKLLK